MLFEKLSQQDKEKIQNYINAYGISPDHDMPTKPQASLSHILRCWDNEKQELYQLLGNNFILEKHVNLTVDTQLLIKNLKAMYNSNKTLRGSEYQDILQNFFEWIIETAAQHWAYTMAYHENHKVDEHLSSQLIALDDRYFTYTGLANNVYEGMSGIFMLPDSDKPFQVKRNMRLTRIIERFRKAYGGTKFTEEDMAKLIDLIAIARSSANNSFDLCLSIHPLDYMTMSDNAKNWSSCMSWKDHTGDYRLGTVECMNSTTVIMAYIKDKNDMQLTYRGETWNNKTWRQLFIVSDTSIIAVKGYPFQNDKAVELVLDWLKKLAADNWHKQYDADGYITDNAGEIFFNDDTTLSVEVKPNVYVCPLLNIEWNYMYDDIGTLQRHAVLIDTKTLRTITQHLYPYDSTHCSIHIIASGLSECLWCGGEIDNEKDGDENDDGCQNLVFCSDCSPWVELSYCDHCGCRVNSSELTYIPNMGIYVCESCIDELVEDQISDGHMIWSDDAEKVHLALGFKENGELQIEPDKELLVDREYNYTHEELGRYFKDPENITTIITSRPSFYYGWINVVLPQDLTDEGLRYFLKRNTVEQKVKDYKLTRITDEFAENWDRDKFYCPIEAQTKKYRCALDGNSFTRWRFIR